MFLNYSIIFSTRHICPDPLTLRLLSHFGHTACLVRVFPSLLLSLCLHPFWGVFAQVTVDWLPLTGKSVCLPQLRSPPSACASCPPPAPPLSPSYAFSPPLLWVRHWGCRDALEASLTPQGAPTKGFVLLSITRNQGLLGNSISGWLRFEPVSSVFLCESCLRFFWV